MKWISIILLYISVLSLEAVEFNFQEKQMSTLEALVHVDFFDEKNGIVSDARGNMFYTNDGGIFWEKVKYDFEFRAFHVRYLRNGEILATGSESKIIKSFDYGKTWSIVYDHSSFDIFANFRCFSPFECFIYTILGNYYKFYPQNSKLVKINNAPSNIFDIVGNRMVFSAGDEVIAKSCMIIERDPPQPPYYLYYVILQGLETENFELYDKYIYNEFEIKEENYHEFQMPFIVSLGNNRFAANINNRYLYHSEFDLNYRLDNFLYQTKIVNNDTLSFYNFYGDPNLIVLPHNKGYISFINLNEKHKIEMDTTFKISERKLHDYYQISENRGIALGEEGKYYIIELGTTSVEEFKNQDGIKIYPNPVQDEFKVQFQNTQLVSSVELIDINGKVVKRDLLNSFINNYEIKTNELAKGIYFLKISTKDGIIHRKIVIL